MHDIRKNFHSVLCYFSGNPIENMQFSGAGKILIEKLKFFINKKEKFRALYTADPKKELKMVQFESSWTSIDNNKWNRLTISENQAFNEKLKVIFIRVRRCEIFTVDGAADVAEEKTNFECSVQKLFVDEKRKS